MRYKIVEIYLPNWTPLKTWRFIGTTEDLSTILALTPDDDIIAIDDKIKTEVTAVLESSVKYSIAECLVNLL